MTDRHNNDTPDNSGKRTEDPNLNEDQQQAGFSAYDNLNEEDQDSPADELDSGADDNQEASDEVAEKPESSEPPRRGPLDQPAELESKDEPDSEPRDESDDDLPSGQMGLLDHLGELRTVLIHSSIAALIATILCWFWSATLLDMLIMPIKEQGVYFTAPNEAFLTRLKISGAVGLFVVVPFIFFKIYQFILPGLYSKERKVVTPLLLATTLLFYAGVAFGFAIVIPQVISFLMSFGTQAMAPLIGVGPYFSFVSRLCLAFGLVFELPLLVLLLSVLGIVNPKMLLRTWRAAIVVIVAMSALLTPPDIISQVMMAGPVLVLYLASVLIAIIVTRKKRKQD